PPSAAPGAAPQYVGHLMPAHRGQPGIASAGSGASTGDFTGDGRQDILARHRDTGQLRVYPHSGTYNGTLTYRPPTTINFNWSDQRWIGRGKVAGNSTGQARELSDVISIDYAGRMVVHPHSGRFAGTSTLRAPSVVVGTNWFINDLVFVYDVNADGWDDLLARRAGTGNTYVYLHSGVFNGTATFQAPQLLVSGGASDVDQNMADVTLDGVPDLVSVNGGVLLVFSFADNRLFSLGYGWDTIDSVTLTDIDGDGRTDILGRVRANGNLQVYTHSGRWNPDQIGLAYDTYRTPLVVGLQWNINDVIT
ncbi:VCBS repeat-containing protein, partial [Actinophytocola sp.]|uniref:FG-GAP repeat domain-containing protein n=1 Tax=Actinophytocola sp. TaxID=1872138 RepID=UPI002D80E3D7